MVWKSTNCRPGKNIASPWHFPLFSILVKTLPFYVLPAWKTTLWGWAPPIHIIVLYKECPTPPPPLHCDDLCADLLLWRKDIIANMPASGHNLQNVLWIPYMYNGVKINQLQAWEKHSIAVALSPLFNTCENPALLCASSMENNPMRLSTPNSYYSPLQRMPHPPPPPSLWWPVCRSPAMKERYNCKHACFRAQPAKCTLNTLHVQWCENQPIAGLGKT